MMSWPGQQCPRCGFSEKKQWCRTCKYGDMTHGAPWCKKYDMHIPDEVFVCCHWIEKKP